MKRGCALAVSAALALSGCAAGGGAWQNTGRTAPFQDPALSMTTAATMLTPGVSTRAQVQAALGRAPTVIRFDSGFEVWDYRARDQVPAAEKAELVLLFDSAGVLRKTRMRPGR